MLSVCLSENPRLLRIFRERPGAFSFSKIPLKSPRSEFFKFYKCKIIYQKVRRGTKGQNVVEPTHPQHDKGQNPLNLLIKIPYRVFLQISLVCLPKSSTYFHRNFRENPSRSFVKVPQLRKDYSIVYFWEHALSSTHGFTFKIRQ